MAGRVYTGLHGCGGCALLVANGQSRLRGLGLIRPGVVRLVRHQRRRGWPVGGSSGTGQFGLSVTVTELASHRIGPKRYRFTAEPGLQGPTTRG